MNTGAENSHIFWKVLNRNIKLIAVDYEKRAPDEHLSVLLENVFNAMIMVLGKTALVEVHLLLSLTMKMCSCAIHMSSTLS